MDEFIYLVYDPKAYLENSAVAFDSLPQAKQFAKKFAENSDFEIEKLRINPRFPVVKDLTFYCVSFSTLNNDCESCLGDYSFDKVRREPTYEVRRSEGHYYLRVFLLAENEPDAILKASRKRDELRDSGEYPGRDYIPWF